MFDAIVIGSGISGGWAAKELTERGLKVLVLERGRHVTHGEDYVGEHKAPWDMPYHGLGDRQRNEAEYYVQKQARAFEEGADQFFVNDKDHPYQVAEGTNFSWIRGYHLGGRSLTWGRVALRFGDVNFGENKRDGHGSDWPIRYADLAPWYSHVEKFIGVSGTSNGFDTIPDGEMLPPFPLNCLEEHIATSLTKSGRAMIPARSAVLSVDHNGRSACHMCGPCHRGCSTSSYFSSLGSTLPAAEATGRLTIMSDMIVAGLDHDPKTKRVTAVRTINAKTGQAQSFGAKLIFLNASTLGTTHILLNSRSEASPNGLANGSGMLGRNLMDHVMSPMIAGSFDGFTDMMPIGNRPTGIYIPRFRNMKERHPDFVRGYGYQGSASRELWIRGASGPAMGAALKTELRQAGPWRMLLGGMGECLPYESNRVVLDETKRDKWGLPQLKVHFEWGANELAMAKDMVSEATAMLTEAGARKVTVMGDLNPGGLAIHEMGTARMGNDPRASVLNAHNQAHDVANLFVTDGASMVSSACQNPSLTYMALTARAAAYAVDQVKAGTI
jgi:choline dehydrogenase-like flavoprotein